MVVSVYICEIPKNITKKDIENLFGDYDGYIETRMKGTNDNRKIAFVDYENEKDAMFVIESLQSFRFAPEDKGLILKISDNTKSGITQKDDKYLRNKKRRSSSHERIDKKIQGRTNEKTTLPYKKEEEKSNNPNMLELLTLIAGINNNPKNTSTNNFPNSNSYIMTDQTQQTNTDNSNVNLVDVLQNLQAFQLLSTLANTPTPVETKSNNKTNFASAFSQYDDNFKSLMDFKKHATNIVYVEGLPLDITEREVAHIFRPFPGFKSVRLITREKKGEKSILCFADFEDVIQSTVCINTLQGYRFDKNDLIGLHFSYGISKYKSDK